MASLTESEIQLLRQLMIAPYVVANQIPADRQNEQRSINRHTRPDDHRETVMIGGNECMMVPVRAPVLYACNCSYMAELVSWLITGMVAPGALTPFVP